MPIKTTISKSITLPSQTGALFFSLPEESESFEMAVHASSYKYALQEFDEVLRQKVKWCDDQGMVDIAEELRTKMREILESKGVSLW